MTSSENEASLRDACEKAWREIGLSDLANPLDELFFERKWLLAQLECGGTEEGSLERDLIMRKLNEVDLRIAATPSKSFADLSGKLIRFSEIEYPSIESIPEDSLDTILLKSILRDVQRLAADECAT